MDFLDTWKAQFTSTSYHGQPQRGPGTRTPVSQQPCRAVMCTVKEVNFPCSCTCEVLLRHSAHLCCGTNLRRFKSTSSPNLRPFIQMSPPLGSHQPCTTSECPIHLLPLHTLAYLGGTIFLSCFHPSEVDQIHPLVFLCAFFCLRPSPSCAPHAHYSEANMPLHLSSSYSNPRQMQHTTLFCWEGLRAPLIYSYLHTGSSQGSAGLLGHCLSEE